MAFYFNYLVPPVRLLLKSHGLFLLLEYYPSLDFIGCGQHGKEEALVNLKKI
jgi:hypothetical protein